MKTRVLLVDDESGLLEIAKTFLERGNELTIDTVLSAEDAIGKLGRIDYDAIVSDYQMPGMNGIELLKALRGAGDKTPFILFTGRGREDVAIDALNNGASFYLQKGGDVIPQFAELSNMIRLSVQHVRSEEAMRASENMLSAIIDQSPMSTWISDANGTPIRQNQACRDLFGIDSDEQTLGVYNLLNDPVLKEQGHMPAIEAVFREGRTARILVDYDFSKVGMVNVPRATHRMIQGTIFPVKDLTGKVVNAVVMHEDVTDHLRMEQALIEGEERYRSLIEEDQDMAFVVGQDGLIRYVNKASAVYLGRSQLDLMEKPLSSVFPAEVVEGLMEDIRAVISRGQVVETELLLPFRGRNIWVKTRLTPHRDASGRIDGILGISRDVTENKAAIDALKTSEEKFAKAFQSSPAMMAIFTAEDYRLVDANDRFFQVNSLARENAIGLSAGELGLISPGMIERFAKEFVQKGRLIGIDVDFETRSGKALHGLFSAEGVVIDGKPHILVHISDVTRLKELERSIKSFTSTLESIINTSPSPIIVVNNNNLVTLWSKSAENIFGWKAEEVLGKPNPIVPEQKADEYKDILDLVKEGRSITGKDVVRQRKDSSLVDLSVSTAALRDEQGRIVGVMGVFNDLSERKAAEQALYNTTKTLESFFLASPLPIIGMDQDGKVTMWSRAAEELYGWKSEEVLGSVNPMIPKHALKESLEGVRRMLQDKKPLVIEVPAVTSHGSKIEIRISIAPVLDENGNALGVMSVSADITGQKMRDAELREALERRKELEAIVEMSPAVAFLWEPTESWPVLFASGSVRQFGYTPEDFTSRRVTYTNLVHPDDLKRVEEEANQYAIQGFTDYSQVYRIVTKSGEVRWVDDRSKVRRDASGTPILHEGVVIDITEQRGVERALRQANKKLNLLGSVTRHDAVNQLSVLFAWLDIAKEVAGDHAVKEHLDRIQEAARTLNRQLEFTADYQDMGVKEPAWFSLVAQVEKGVEGLDLGGVEVIAELKGIRVFADPMLEKVFYNLIENSLRHGERVTKIRFYATESNDGLTVFCEDDGVGIPVDEKEKIFERGFGKHTGFGLYMVREVLGITGITVSETGEPGKGAKFEMHVTRENYHFETNNG